MWASGAPRRFLEHSILYLAFAPQLTRLEFTTMYHSLVEMSRLLQPLQHLKHLKHLTTGGPTAAEDAFDSMLMVRLWTIRSQVLYACSCLRDICIHGLLIRKGCKCKACLALLCKPFNRSVYVRSQCMLVVRT